MFIAIKIRKRLVIVLTCIMFLVILALCFKDNIREYLKISYRKFYLITISNDEIVNLEENLNINKINYNWMENLNFNNKPRKIIFHHAARSVWDPYGINDFHKSKGWKGIGYNYYIRKDGTIYLGRDENAEGAHAKGENSSSIGICLEGNFEEEDISSEQLISIERLSYYLVLKYDIYEIIGHRNVGETLCPGKNFPLEDIRDRILSDIKEKKKSI